MTSLARCRLIHGADNYRSKQVLAAIVARFRAQSHSLADCVTYDMEETSLEALGQTLLAQPFFVAKRLFILRRTFEAPKATLDGLPALLASLPPTTYVVCAEAKPCDKRLGLYGWLKTHGIENEHRAMSEGQLETWLISLARERALRWEGAALRLVIAYGGDNKSDRFRLESETDKLAYYARSRGENIITAEAVSRLCAPYPGTTLFGLTDSLRKGDLEDSLRQIRQMRHEEPLALAGLMASYVRSLVKLHLAACQGLTEETQLAAATGLKPYVVRLVWPAAKRIGVWQLRSAYDMLAKFDISVKRGIMPPDLGLVLLTLGLHATLKKD